MNLQDKINNAKNLSELVEILNGFQGDNECGGKLEENCDLCNLPTFGKEPKYTMEIFSWDDDNVMIDTSNGFITVERTEEFGE